MVANDLAKIEVRVRAPLFTPILSTVQSDWWSYWKVGQW